MFHAGIFDTGCAGKKITKLESQVQRHETDINQIYQSLLKLDQTLQELNTFIRENKDSNTEKLQNKMDKLQEDSERLRREFESRNTLKKQEEIAQELKTELANINQKIDDKIKPPPAKKYCPIKKVAKSDVTPAMRAQEVPASVSPAKKKIRKKKKATPAIKEFPSVIENPCESTVLPSPPA